MRFPLASDLISRSGQTDRDAQLVNAVVEVRGEEYAVRSRPGVSNAIATDLGLWAQGGVQFGPYAVFLNDDVLTIYDTDLGELPDAVMGGTGIGDGSDTIGGGGGGGGDEDGDGSADYPNEVVTLTKVAETNLFDVKYNNLFVVGNLVIVYDEDIGANHVSADLETWFTYEWVDYLPFSITPATWVFDGVLYSANDLSGEISKTTTGSWIDGGPFPAEFPLISYGACEFGGYVYCFNNSSSKVRRSNDGTTFYDVSHTGLVGAPYGTVQNVAVLPTGPKMIFVGDAAAGNVKSTTNGTDWTLETSSLDSVGLNYQQLAVHGNYAWLIGGDQEQVKRSFNGAAWRQMSIDPDSDPFTIPVTGSKQKAFSFGGNLYYAVKNDTSGKTEFLKLTTRLTTITLPL